MINLPPDPEGIIADMLAALEYAADKLIAVQCAETDDQEMRIIDNINQVIRATIAKATGKETNA